MALRVTHRASAVLKELLERHEHEPDQAIRLVSDAQGEGLVLGTEGERYQAIKHDGATVLIVEPSVNARFSNMTLISSKHRKGILGPSSDHPPYRFQLLIHDCLHVGGSEPPG